MLWVDAHNGKNIVNIMYRTGLYDYIVEGYLLEENGNYSTLYTDRRENGIIHRRSQGMGDTAEAVENALNSESRNMQGFL